MKNQSDPANVVLELLYVGVLGEKTDPVSQQLVRFEHEYLQGSEGVGVATEEDWENVTK